MSISKISVQQTKKKENKPVVSYKQATKSEMEKPEAFIDQLKKERKTFLVIEDGYEKKYFFNQNNYVISSKRVK